MDFVEKLTIAVIALLGVGLLGSIVIGFTGLHYETSRGEHTGYITAVEKTGVFFKTGRAYLKTDTQSSQEDAYCVVDEKVYQQLQELSVNRKNVSVKYFSWLSLGVKNCEGEDAVIYEVI
mgnify:CR=1 FL=1